MLYVCTMKRLKSFFKYYSQLPALIPISLLANIGAGVLWHFKLAYPIEFVFFCLTIINVLMIPLIFICSFFFDEEDANHSDPPQALIGDIVATYSVVAIIFMAAGLVISLWSGLAVSYTHLTLPTIYSV